MFFAKRPVVRQSALTAALLTALLAVPAGACLTAEVEPNESDASASGAICSGVTVNGDIANANDIDWYYLNVAAAGDVVISLDHASADDFDWYFYEETGPYVASGVSTSVPDEGTYTVSAPGLYFIKVKQYAGKGWYTLDVTFPDSSGDTTPPAAPTGLAATAGAGQVSLDWNDNGEGDLDGYFIYRATSSAGPFSALNSVAHASSDYLDTGVTGGTTYYYQVTAVDVSANESAASAQASATPTNGGGASCNYGPRPTKPGGLKNWLTGDGNDACVNLDNGPGILMMGGSTEVDAGFVNRAAPIINGGDVVVIRTSGSNGYNDYLYNLISPDSVETLLIDKATKADSDYVDWVIRSAELLWMAGGDQSLHLNAWLGTRVEDAIRHVYEKGGVVGGTSAGHAVLSQVIYDPDGIGSSISSEAVTDPCHADINLSLDFLNLPYMMGVVNDSHFGERDRMGRLLTFMARIREGGLSPTVNPILGLGIDEQTSFFVDANGLGVVDGNNAVYVLKEDGQTYATQVICGSPVVYGDVLRYKLTAGDTYDLSNGQSSAGAIRIGIDGNNTGFYLPSDPY